MKPQDLEAASIRFGIELETKIPARCGLPVGAYHRGRDVHGACAPDGEFLVAPTFEGRPWKAEMDGSIHAEAGERACEFVSPILHGEEGLEALCRFVEWMNRIGAKVDRSCGCHITVGIESVIGTGDAEAVSQFVRKLAHIGHWHAKSLFGQTGTGRHLNHYAHALNDDVDRLMRRVVRTYSVREKSQAAHNCGRGMINFRKAFQQDACGRFLGVVEFRVFAGTTSLEKILHHLGTVLGLCRRAHQVECLGGFRRNRDQSTRTPSARAALDFLWDYLGWTGGKRPVALGLFGRLHGEFPNYRREAIRLCEKFDAQYPNADL